MEDEAEDDKAEEEEEEEERNNFKIQWPTIPKQEADTF